MNGFSTPSPRWAPVPNYPSYEVSDTGLVLSRRRPTPRLLTGSPSGDGYLKVHLFDGRFVYIHRLVALVHIGPPPHDMEEPTVDHVDFDRANNHVTNLRWSEHVVNSQRHRLSADP